MKSFLLALLTGVLFALSLPPFNQAWIAWFAVAPLLIGAQDRRPLERIGLGLLAGVAAGFVHVGVKGDTTARLYGYLPYLYVAGIFCIQAAVSPAIRRRWTGLPRVVFVACLGVTLEWFTTFSPLPVTVALSQYQTIALIQIGAITGTWGISFLLWLANAAIADTLLTRRLRLAVVATPILLILAAVVYSQIELAHQPATPVVRIAAIQDHDPQETTEFVPAPAVDSTPSQEQLTRMARANGAQLAVWSEGSLGSSFVPGARINPTEKLARQLGMYLVVGFTQSAQDLGAAAHPSLRAHPKVVSPIKGYNCAGIVEPNGVTRAIYHKIHLFGGEAMSYQSGHIVKAFPTAVGKVGMEICFDSCFADITRRLALDGAQIVAVPNFDPLTEHGDLHRLHPALLPLRAVENHVAIVRSDPNGHSLIVAPDGRIAADAPMWTADALVANIPLGAGRGTFYSRAGDWFAYLCVLFVAVSAAAPLFRRRRVAANIPAGTAREPAPEPAAP